MGQSVKSGLECGRKGISAAFMVLVCVAGETWATMSIVAVDPVTKEVGGAGASCLQGSNGGVLIISDLEPGRWALHTQSYWNASNQRNARTRMASGLSPRETMDWLSRNDVQGSPGIRQYGAASLIGDSAVAAAFTGIDCGDWKGHLVGKDYAIQGNILKGREVLDSMQARFLRTPGSLADRLMAAMQGANVAGADSRCLEEGVSSQSAFLRVAKPGDAAGSFHIDLQVPSRPRGREPIDSLQRLYDRWKATNPTGVARKDAFYLRGKGSGRLEMRRVRTHGGIQWVFPVPESGRGSGVRIFILNGAENKGAGRHPGLQ